MNIQLGPTTTPRSNFIAEATLPTGTPTDEAWEMFDTERGKATPAQIDAVSGEIRACWWVDELAPGDRRMFELRPAPAGAKTPRGIDVDDQPENGRAVVYYGGLLQSMYHYGLPNYRPYFWPNVAPSGRAGSGVESTDGSQPKSITDDGPPDHVWHK